MQIQVKKQLKIELDQADMIEAVGDYLSKHGQRVSTAELEAISFVKSPTTGLRATLNITEESGMDTDATGEAEKKSTPVSAVGTTANPEVIADAVTEVEQPVKAEDEPGAVEPSTVDDVAPAVEAAIERAVAVVEEQEEEVVPAATTTEDEEDESVVPTEKPKSLFL